MAYDNTNFYGDLIVSEYDDKGNFMTPQTPTGYYVYHILGDGFDLMSEMCNQFMNDYSILTASTRGLDNFWGVSYNMPRPLLYEGQRADYLFVDNGTTASHNDSWNVTNGTMTRMDSYTRLVESAQTLMCQMNSGYISPTSIVEFDFKAVDGDKNWGLVYIRNSGGGTSLANFSLNSVGGEIGEWIHLKIVFNNTSTITIYSSKLDNPITRTLSSTSPNYRLLLFSGGANTELHFKNVKVYTGEGKERPLTDEEYKIYLYLRNCRLMTREDIEINMNKCFAIGGQNIFFTTETNYLSAVSHLDYVSRDTGTSNIAKNLEDDTLNFITDFEGDEETLTFESGLSVVEEVVEVVNVPANNYDPAFLELLEKYISVKGNLKIKEYSI